MSQKHQEDLSHIRSMMERSATFISLSGLSGVFAGLAALVGGIYMRQIFKNYGIEYFDSTKKGYDQSLLLECFGVAAIVLITALVFGIFFTLRKSKKYHLPVWTNATKKMLVHLAIPLLAGGVFCAALVYHQLFAWIAPSTLLFYGLALVNAEKFTFSDVKYLGFLEIILGSVSLFFLSHGLVFWIFGFGFLHIFYGLMMFKKYK